MAEKDQVIFEAEVNPKVREKRHLAVAGWVYGVLSVILVVLVFVVRTESVLKDSGDRLVQVTICNPIIRSVIETLFVYNILVLFLILILAMIFRRGTLTGIMLFVIFFCLFPIFIALVGYSTRLWQIADQATGPDKRIYCYMSHFCAKSLTRLENQTWFTRTFTVLSDNPGDSDAVVIRPVEGFRGEGPKVYFTRADLVLGLYDMDCHVAYDLRTGRSWGWRSDFSDISPFVLMEANTRPYPPDVKELDRAKPAVSWMEAGLKDPNPEVRKIARRVLERYEIRVEQ